MKSLKLVLYPKEPCEDQRDAAEDIFLSLATVSPKAHQTTPETSRSSRYTVYEITIFTVLKITLSQKCKTLNIRQKLKCIGVRLHVSDNA